MLVYSPEPTDYTYSDGQCWGDYGCDAKTDAPAASQTEAAASTPAAVEAQPTQATSDVTTQSDSSSGVNAGDILGYVGGILAPSSDGSCVEGSGNKNVVEISNQSGDDLVWLCWGGAGSWVNVDAPIMALGISNGDTQTISFADTASGQQGGACAPVTLDTTTANGQINNTWLEATFNEWGTVDVSREVNMYGHSITAKTAAGCTSSMDWCVFKCNDQGGTDNSGHCGDAGSYGLVSCSGTGVNADSSDPSNGGCQVGSGTMSVTVGPKATSY